jgi:hypothetical protein
LAALKEVFFYIFGSISSGTYLMRLVVAPRSDARALPVGPSLGGGAALAILSTIGATRQVFGRELESQIIQKYIISTTLINFVAK